MSGPLSGVGQQIPLSQPFQPGGQQGAVRPQEQEPQSGRVQPQGAAASESQPSEESDEQNILQQLLREASQGSADVPDENAPRGSVVDLQV